MKTSELFNDDFNEHFKAVFPNAKNWLESETNGFVDVEALAKDAGLVIHHANFDDLSKDDLRFGRRRDEPSYAEGDILYINTKYDNNRQRFAIAHEIGHRMAQQSRQERDESKTVVAKPQHIGQKQPLPQAVYDFFIGRRFGALKEDSLANMVLALDKTAIPEIKDWWHADNAEAKLANAYLYGFVPESQSPEARRRRGLLALITVKTMTMVNADTHLFIMFFKDQNKDTWRFSVLPEFDDVPAEQERQLYSPLSVEDIDALVAGLKDLNIADIKFVNKNDHIKELTIKARA